MQKKIACRRWKANWLVFESDVIRRWLNWNSSHRAGVSNEAQILNLFGGGNCVILKLWFCSSFFLREREREKLPKNVLQFAFRNWLHVRRAKQVISIVLNALSARVNYLESVWKAWKTHRIFRAVTVLSWTNWKSYQTMTVDLMRIENFEERISLNRPANENTYEKVNRWATVEITRKTNANKTHCFRFLWDLYSLWIALRNG